MDIDRSSWEKIIATNMSAPLFLTQALLPQLKRCAELEDKKKARVLHISSGAAKSAYCGWGPYCVSKSGLNMMYRCLALELSREILVGSMRPGVVDTDMQLPIREFAGPDGTFPMKAKFVDLHKNGQLERPENVARYCHYLLSSVGGEEFIADEFDIRNDKANENWLRYQSKDGN